MSLLKGFGAPRASGAKKEKMGGSLFDSIGSRKKTADGLGTSAKTMIAGTVGLGVAVSSSAPKTGLSTLGASGSSKLAAKRDKKKKGLFGQLETEVTAEGGAEKGVPEVRFDP